MKILAFDTSNSCCSVGLYIDGLLFAQNTEQLQSSFLLPFIQDLLEKNMVNIRDLDYILLTNGPGSFTGVRVGLATAIGFRLSHNLKVATINTLASIYINFLALNNSKAKILVINEAPKEEIYYQYFQNMEPLTSTPILGTIEQLPLISKDVLSIGSSKNKIPSLLKNYITIPTINMSLVAKSFVDTSFSSHLFNLGDSIKPLYLRSANINFSNNSR
jgi:tRNA threonylcarbamoyladenosine biosynthesis protein TsaB